MNQLKFIFFLPLFYTNFLFAQNDIDSVYYTNQNGMQVLVKMSKKSGKPINSIEAEKLKEAEKRDKIKVSKNILVSDYDTSKIQFQLTNCWLKAFNPQNLKDTISILYFKTTFYYPQMSFCKNDGWLFSFCFKGMLSHIDEKYFDGKKTLFKISDIIVKLPNGKITVLKKEILYPKTPMKQISCICGY